MGLLGSPFCGLLNVVGSCFVTLEGGRLSSSPVWGGRACGTTVSLTVPIQDVVLSIRSRGSLRLVREYQVVRFLYLLL
jgi:hypothetical protein